MMQKANRFVGFVLSLCMLLGLLPVSVLAAEPAPDHAAKEKEALCASTQSTADAPSGYIRNAYIEAYINANGHYTIGTVGGSPDTMTDDNQPLLFGHPDSSTTETLVRIDGQDYFFDDYVQDISFHNGQCSVYAVIDDVEVTQLLRLAVNPYTNLEDVVDIRYICTNNSAETRQVGVRIMLDTMLGSNDGAPFRVNGEAVTTEREYQGGSIPQYWQSFDSLNAPNVTATGFFYFSEEEKPDKVQFAYWRDIVHSSWDYRVSPDSSLTGDSAVAAYFSPRAVAAGGSRTVVTHYGVSGFSSGNTDLDGELAVRVTAPSNLYSAHEIQELPDTDDRIVGYLNNPFDISVYMTNNGSEDIRDLKAVLVLDNEDRLHLDASQPEIRSLGSLEAGASRSFKWRVRAVAEQQSSTQTYHILFFRDGEQIKKMDFSLVLNGLKEEEAWCTVSFDLNGGEGTAPAAKRVRCGEPLFSGSNKYDLEHPVRPGYRFAGWYPNPQCQGRPWFDFFTLDDRLTLCGYPVRSDMTLFAGWVEDTRYIREGQDHFQFVNTESHFFNSTKGSYNITGDYYHILMDDLSDGLFSSEKTRVLQKMNSTWTGSCFGMSAVLALVRAGELYPGFFQADASCPYDLDYPRDSRTVFNLINYYHLNQYTAYTGEYTSEHPFSQTAACKDILQSLQDSDYPVIVELLAEVKHGDDWGHVVLAYGYTQDDDEYLVKISDPNYPGETNILHISTDNKTAYFDDHYVNDDHTEYRLLSAYTIEEKPFKKNLQKELIRRDHGGMGGRSALSVMSSAEEEEALLLQTNYTAFSILAADGSTLACIEDGKKVSGALEISNAHYLSEAGAEPELMFSIHGLNGAACTIVPDAPSAKAGGVCKTALSLDSRDGFYAGAETESAGAVTFAPDGEMTTAFTAPVRQSLTVADNCAGTPWYAVTAEAVTAGMTADADSTAARIACASEAQVTVTAQGTYNSLHFDPCTVGAEGVALTEDPAQPGTGILDVQRQTLGHALIFASQGGSPVAAQTDIPSGTAAVRPQDPTRPGFVFDGWYTSPDGGYDHLWSFDTPITQDTTLYARWLADASASHIVTFRAAGHDDMLILVPDGAALTPEQLPAVPAKPGYTAAWDVTDFSRITADLLVHAIYTADGNQVTVTYTDGVAEESVFADQVCTTVIGADTPAFVGTPVRSGYTFTGWTPAVADKVTGPAVYTAQWSKNGSGGGGGGGGAVQRVVLRFETNGGAAVPEVRREAGAVVQLSGYAPVRDGYTFAGWYLDKALTRAVTAVKLEQNTTVYAKWTKSAAPSFADVPSDAYYKDAVDWAVENGVTTGLTADSFVPNTVCTRAQTVTFLWRAMGKPAPKTQTMPFTDVAADSCFHDAVLWAVENGITKGLTATAFGPGSSVTRGQAVTFLYRAAKAAPVSAENPFVDVAADSCFHDAVLWAVENGVTRGVTDTRFVPAAGCTRAQIVTFLYRFSAE